jgi:L-fuconolactonase
LDGTEEVSSPLDTLTGFADAHAHIWQRGDVGMEWLDSASDRIPRHSPADGFRDHVGELPLEAVVLVAAVPGEAALHQLMERARHVEVPVSVVAEIDPTEPDAVRSLVASLGSPNSDCLGGIRLAPSASDPAWAARATAAVAGLVGPGMVVEMLTGRRQLPVVLEFAQENETTPVVLDHLGGLADNSLDDSFWRRQMRRLAIAGNINVKLSGWRTPERSGIADDVRFVIDEFGPERVIFGSDWPMVAAAATYADTVESTLELLSWLDEAERDRVMRNNTLQLYGFGFAHASTPIGRTA